MTVYSRLSKAEIEAAIVELRPRLTRWFADNPTRKICKVDWFYGRSIDLRRESFEQRFEAEIKILTK